MQIPFCLPPCQGPLIAAELGFAALGSPGKQSPQKGPVSEIDP